MEAADNTKSKNRKLFQKQRTYARFCALQVLFQMEFNEGWSFSDEQWRMFVCQSAQIYEELALYMPSDVVQCMSDFCLQLSRQDSLRSVLKQLQSERSLEETEGAASKKRKDSQEHSELDDKIEKAEDALNGLMVSIDEMTEALLNLPSMSYAREIVNGIISEHDQIDTEIQTAAKNWRLGRMGRLDRCLLRIAAYEILHVEDVSSAIAINEALDLSKRFCQTDSPRFLNGVLDKLRKNNNR